MVARLLTDGQELFEDIHTSIFSITALWQNCTTPLFGISLGYTPYFGMHPTPQRIGTLSIRDPDLIAGPKIHAIKTVLSLNHF